MLMGDDVGFCAPHISSKLLLSSVNTLEAPIINLSPDLKQVLSLRIPLISYPIYFYID